MKKLFVFMLVTLFMSATSYAKEMTNSETINDKTENVSQSVDDDLLEHLGKAVSGYLVEHPEFLVAASDNLHHRQQIALQQKMTQAAIQQQSRLLSKDSPATGPEGAKVAVIMFFDYQCAYCSKMASIVESLIKNNPDVRFVFKEFPVFAPRWPASGFAARTGEKVWKERGGEAYLAYHNALYATGHMEGKLTTDDIRNIGSSYLSTETLSKLENSTDESSESADLQDIYRLAKDIHLSGTPAFIVMPQQQPKTERVSVIPGSTTEETLQQAILNAKGEQ